MNNRERILAILNKRPADRMVATHFGLWGETAQKFLAEKRFTLDEVGGEFPHNNSAAQHLLMTKLGFDFGWEPFLPVNFFLTPPFERKVLEECADGMRLVRNAYGAVELECAEAGSIPAEVDHLLKDRTSYEEHYRHRLTFDEATRFPMEQYRQLLHNPVFGGDDNPRRLFAGSLFGRLRNAMGVEGVSLLYYDDEGLFREIIDTIGELTFRCVETQLRIGREENVKFDYAHFWEDICFKNGPLVVPDIFAEYVGPHYRKITALLHENGVDLVSLDCDGCIESLAPVWLKNGVNVMFPIELGTWNGNYGRLRELCGEYIRGVGGMNKFVFASDYTVVDREIERLKPYVEMGGFIPCPDHRIPPDAKWENIQYYCDKIKNM